MVEALSSELAKCVLVHEREFELVCLKHKNEDQGLKARIKELTNLARVNNEQKSCPTWVVIEGVGGNWGPRNMSRQQIWRQLW